MARQIIKTTASRFETIQSGHQTCVILNNDRLWSTYDEFWFVECDKEKQPTGRVVLARATFIQFGCEGLQSALSLVSIRPLGSGIEALPIEITTKEVIAAVMNESHETLLMAGRPRQEMLD
jgi:Domain of unknown function (DUF3850)